MNKAIQEMLSFKEDLTRLKASAEEKLESMEFITTKQSEQSASQLEKIQMEIDSLKMYHQQSLQSIPQAVHIHLQSHTP